MKARIAGIALLVIALSIGLTVTYFNSRQRQVPLVFTEKGMIGELYNAHKRDYVEKESGRTVDRQRDNVTTSEGESYTMLRAVWMDDRATFDKSWEWTQKNLKRPNDKLFSWFYGKRPDGSFGILKDKGGENTATDGDQDIALALVLGSQRWQDPEYLRQAREIIGDIWELEVVSVGGKPILAANNLEKAAKDTMVVNPSYFAPYAYKIFAKVDPKHDWNALAANSYDVAERSITGKLNKSQSAGLPPDWITIDKKTGAIQASNQPTLTTNYSYDAMRLPWRFALDWKWNGEPKAKAVLQKMKFLSEQWGSNRSLSATYGHDGQVVEQPESPATYGGDIGYFIVTNPTQGDELYEQKLKTLYDPDKQSWKEPLSYYSDNWAWFGLALHDDALPNLAKDLK